MPSLYCSACEGKKFIELQEVKHSNVRCPDCGTPFPFESLEAGVKASQTQGCVLIMVLVGVALVVYRLLVK